MASALLDHAYRAFAAHLGRLRAEAGVTQRELAGRLAKPKSYVDKIERLERRVDPAEFWAWCAALGRDAAEEFAAVVGRVEQEEPEG